VSNEAESLKEIYPGIEKFFPGLSKSVDKFIEEHKDHVVTRETPPAVMREYTGDLVEIARMVAEGTKKGVEEIGEDQFFRWATLPARKGGITDEGEAVKRVGVSKWGGAEVTYRGTLPFHKGKKWRTSYFVLERVLSGEKGHVLMGLLQRVPKDKGTKPEVHFQGAECFIALGPNIEFTVNDEVFKPEPLEEIITVLPGDTHHHTSIKTPGRVLIIGVCGFRSGKKIKEKEDYHVEAFNEIPRVYSA
jgi:quercetin dioxygenase-like cupin family protein